MAASMVSRQPFFYLGGHDLEMAEIRLLLERHAPGRFADAHLQWGATASAYKADIRQALDEGFDIALIELENDLVPGLVPPGRLIVIDHHGERAGKDMPTAIEQTAALLKVPLSRWQQLVSANDKGHIAGLEDMGADEREIIAIRKADRRAQGISPAGEALARRAIAEARRHASLTLVRTGLATSTAIADFLHPALGGPGYENLLVILKDKAAFFGNGRIIKALCEKFQPCWYGGALPKTGYWGCPLTPASTPEKIIEAVKHHTARRA